MVIFDVDVTAKYIYFEVDGTKYGVNFRDNLRQGVHDISVWIDNKQVDAKIMCAYPPLKRVILELQKIYIPLWLKRKFRK